MRKLVSVLLAAALAISAAVSAPAYADSSGISIEAESAILIDLTTGAVLYEKNADSREYPASTTKILTAILAIENLDMNNILVIDEEVPKTGGTTIGLKNGEKVSVEDLLYVMMVRSANDCAVALAKGVSGTVEDFADLMNAKAAELGCEDSHFTNPHGLHDEDHYSTASDLAKIARYCMRSEIFRDAAVRTSYTTSATNLNEAKTFVTTNFMLNDENKTNMIYVGNELRYCKYEGCIGIKTGYTTEAGACLIAGAERDGTSLVSVVLKSSTYGRFADSIKILEWGFANRRTVNVMEEGEELGFIAVKKGAVNKVAVEAAQDICLTIPIEASSESITTEVILDKSVRAPVEAGTVVGKVKVYEGMTVAGEYDAVTSEAVEEGGPLSYFGISDATAKLILYVILGVILLLFLILFLWILYMRRRMRIKKAQRAARLKAKRETEARRRAVWEKNYEQRYRRDYDYDDF